MRLLISEVTQLFLFLQFDFNKTRKKFFLRYLNYVNEKYNVWRIFEWHITLIIYGQLDTWASWCIFCSYKEKVGINTRGNPCQTKARHRMYFLWAILSRYWTIVGLCLYKFQINGNWILKQLRYMYSFECYNVASDQINIKMVYIIKCSVSKRLYHWFLFG